MLTVKNFHTTGLPRFPKTANNFKCTHTGGKQPPTFKDNKVKLQTLKFVQYIVSTAYIVLT